MVDTSSQLSVGLGRRQKAVLAFVREHPGCTKNQAIVATGKPGGSGQQTIERLIRRGQLLAVKEGRYYGLYIPEGQ